MACRRRERLPFHRHWKSLTQLHLAMCLDSAGGGRRSHPSLVLLHVGSLSPVFLSSFRILAQVHFVGMASQKREMAAAAGLGLEVPNVTVTALSVQGLW